MALYTLIETPSGEQMLVLSLDGHEGCTVLEEGVAAPRLPGLERKEGRWRMKDREATQMAILEQLHSSVLARRIKSLEDRLAKAGL